MVMSDLETKIESRVKNLEANLAAQAKLNDPNALTALEAKFKERIDGLDQTFKAHLHFTEQHQAYLKAQVNAKTGEEQTLFSYFKYLQHEIG